MSLIKLALEQQKTFVQRHPLLTAGIGLTAGIAAADGGLNLYKHIKAGGALKTAMPTIKHGLKEGAIYGGILSAVEPVVTHGIMGQREKKI